MKKEEIVMVMEMCLFNALDTSVNELKKDHEISLMMVVTAAMDFTITLIQNSKKYDEELLLAYANHLTLGPKNMEFPVAEMVRKLYEVLK